MPIAVRPQILRARVMHQRLSPKVNTFTYGAYYLMLPLSQLHQPTTTAHLRVNRPGWISVHEKDHGNRQGSVLPWMEQILQRYQIADAIADILLVTMPSVLGYVFNPVSFWLCLDATQKLRAVLCEVNNTFGETHSYFCMHADGREIDRQDWLRAQKLFHVSPFLHRAGHYRFRFSLYKQKIAIQIDFYNKAGQKQLITALTGKLQPLTRFNLLRANLRHPWITLTTIGLIHWQALKLVLNGIMYIKKPKQSTTRLSCTRTDTD